MAEQPDAKQSPVNDRQIVVAPGTSALTDKAFALIRDLIHRESGITLGDSKKQLVASRLAKRLRVHGLSCYQDYHSLVTTRDVDGSELRELLNAITTNKTEFFRERHHFDFLTQRVFPECIERARVTGERRIRIWSAGCSSGEEPYTIAMTFLDHFPVSSGWSLDITATDLDTHVIENAELGVYPEATVRPVPLPLQKRFLQRGTGANVGKVRVGEELRRLITFRQLNFVAPSWSVHGPFDMIFCRNVMIYFKPETQHTIEQRFAAELRGNGYLFLGHSETMSGLQDLYEPLRGTIYRRRGADESRGLSASTTGASVAPTAPAACASQAYAPSDSPPRPSLSFATPAGDARPLVPPRPARSHRGGDGRDLPKVNLIVGGVRASAEPVILRTVLGSCVCACLHDPIAKVGGINHFLLPNGLDEFAMPTRFGVNAMELLINEILKLGGDRRRLQAKAFGAAHVLSGSGLNPEVPRRNATFIKEFLEKEGIALVSSRLGGSLPVEVVFITDSGRAMVRALGGAIAGDLVREETRHNLEIRKSLVLPQAGSVELF